MPTPGSSRSLADRLARTISIVPILISREIRTRYRTSFLDVAWAVVSPIVVLIVYGLVLTRSFDVGSRCAPYLSSAWIGLVLWTVFATGLGNSVSSLVSSSDLITKVYFPREAVPLAVVGSTMVDLLAGVSSMVVLVVVQGVTLRPMALLALLPILVLVVWTAAASVLFSVLAVFARDLVHGVHLVLRVGFFGTPVMYESYLLPRGLGWTANVNPVAVAIEGVRDSVLCDGAPKVPLLLLHLGVGLAVLAIGIVYTRSIESRLVDLV